MINDFMETVLKQNGYLVGPRDPNKRRGLVGRYMVASSSEDENFCIVGDDMQNLIVAAYESLDLKASELTPWNEEDPTPPAEYGLCVQSDRIDLVFESGEAIWIERQDGRIRVHCFHPLNEAPVNVEIHDNRIEIDSHDHNARH